MFNLQKVMNFNQINLFRIEIIIKWPWYSSNQQINEKSDKKNKTKGGKIDLRCGAPRLVSQNRNKTDGKPEPKKHINTIVAISDVKSKSFFSNY